MDLVWRPSAWEHYVYWQNTDRKVLLRINALIKDSLRSPFAGIGKPELLRGNFTGCWSRRINEEHRLVYAVRENKLYILSCRFHYDK